MTPNVRPGGPAFPVERKPGPETPCRRPEPRFPAGQDMAAMKMRGHRDEDMLLAIGIICTLAGLAWWWWTRMTDRAYDRGKSLGALEGYTRYLGRRIGCNLEDDEGLQDFMEMYEEKVSGSKLPESPELRRTVFKPDPEDTPSMHEQDCEKWRVAGIAMWYVMGAMHQGSSQERLKEILYNLYEKHGEPLDVLKAELGDRDRSAR